MTPPGVRGGELQSFARPLVIAANRLPVRFEPATDRWLCAPGGLVSALRPVAARQGARWVGWNDSAAPLPVLDGLDLAPLRLEPHCADAYYSGCANRTLWPALHGKRAAVEQRPEWWRAYLEVNDLFAKRIATVAPRDSLVWLQDYHLLTCPGLLAKMRPDLTIGLFLHTPVADPGMLVALDRYDAIQHGLGSVALIGTQTDSDAASIRSLVAGSQARVSTYPISIDVDQVRRVAADPLVRALGRSLRAELGGGRRILLGVDRLDYTKGIPERLLAFRHLLETGAVSADDVVFVQIAAPSRQEVPAYRRLVDNVAEITASFVDLTSSRGEPSVHLISDNMPFEEVVGYYLAADIAVVTPHRDGMNLVCKEFMVARGGDPVSLVLSEGAGAVRELREFADVVDGSDSASVATGLTRALRRAPAEAARRSRSSAGYIASHDVHRWAGEYLGDLGRFAICGARAERRAVRPTAR